MKYDISEKLKDSETTWRVRVGVNGDNIFLFFNHNPTVKEVKGVVDGYLQSVQDSIANAVDTDISCNLKQLRKTLNKTGLKDAVEAAILPSFNGLKDLMKEASQA